MTGSACSKKIQITIMVQVCTRTCELFFRTWYILKISSGHWQGSENMVSHVCLSQRKQLTTSVKIWHWSPSSIPHIMKQSLAPGWMFTLYFFQPGNVPLTTLRLNGWKLEYLFLKYLQTFCCVSPHLSLLCVLVWYDARWLCDFVCLLRSDCVTGLHEMEKARYGVCTGWGRLYIKKRAEASPRTVFTLCCSEICSQLLWVGGEDRWIVCIHYIDAGMFVNMGLSSGVLVYIVA